MEPGVRAAGGVSPAQREPGSPAPGGPGWRSLFRPEPDSALQSQAGTFTGSACATLKFLLERDLEEEREALLEDQKICRSRARKLCIETNRRRKALEEKQRAKEEKELRSREQILKQRKLKLQEATEKFQRAHLPFSQRKRIVQRKPAPQLEEALEQIQGSVLTSGLYLSSSNRHKSSCRTTDSPSDSSESKNGFLHRKQISTNGGYDKMIQENSGTNLDNDQLLFQQNLEEMQQLLEKQHLSSLAEIMLPASCLQCHLEVRTGVHLPLLQPMSQDIYVPDVLKIHMSLHASITIPCVHADDGFFLVTAQSSRMFVFII